MDSVIVRMGLLLLTSSVVSMIARRLRIPYTVGLVIAGIGFSLAPIAQPIELTRDLVFTVLLPPLIFEAAFQLKWADLRRDLPVIGLLATLGIAISTLIVGAGLNLLLGWSWPVSILVAVMLSATDPVAVIATFKSLRVTGRLQLLVEAESLFNDGTAAVLFGIALAAANGSPWSVGGITAGFLYTTVGGILCGLLIGGCALIIAGRTDDHLVEISFTTIAAYGSFILAESFHCSGVLATLATGVLLGNVGSLGAFTDAGREAVESFWEYVAFLANSVVFLLIGSSLVFHEIATVWTAVAITAVLLLLARAVATYACCGVFFRTGLRVPFEYQHVLFWGGLRGALALALALGLPAGFEHRHVILNVTFAVVASSVILQGITMRPLLDRLCVLGGRTSG